MGSVGNKLIQRAKEQAVWRLPKHKMRNLSNHFLQQSCGEEQVAGHGMSISFRLL